MAENQWYNCLGHYSRLCYGGTMGGSIIRMLQEALLWVHYGGLSYGSATKGSVIEAPWEAL